MIWVSKSGFQGGQGAATSCRTGPQFSLAVEPLLAAVEKAAWARKYYKSIAYSKDKGIDDRLALPT
jgi:hypothetical protein